MKDFVNKVLGELRSDSELNENALVRMMLESTSKSIVNNDSYDNIYTQLKDSLTGINEHLKNTKIGSILNQFGKNEITDDSILYEMSKIGNLTSQLEVIRESNAYTNPIIRTKVDNYATKLKTGSSEFQLYPSFISDFSSHIHESSVKTAVTHVTNIMENRASDFEVLNTIKLMEQNGSYLYEGIAASLKKSLANNKYSADIINLTHGTSGLPLVTSLVNNLRITESKVDGSFTLGAGNTETRITNTIAPAQKIKGGIIAFIDNKFIKIAEGTNLSGNEAEVHINEQFVQAGIAALWATLDPSDKKKIKHAVKNPGSLVKKGADAYVGTAKKAASLGKKVGDAYVNTAKKVTKATVKASLTGLKNAEAVGKWIAASPSNPATWFSANEGFTIATMDPEFIKAKFPVLYNLSEAYATLGFKDAEHIEGVESNSIRNFKLGLNTNESNGLDIYLNDNKVDGLDSINLTEALVMETPDVRNRVEYVFDHLSKITAFEFIKNVSNDRLISEATVFELNGNYIVCDKPNAVQRTWGKVDEHAMYNFFNEKFQYDISPIFGTKIEESLETKKKIEVAKTAILENVSKLEGSVIKLQETINANEADKADISKLETLKESIKASISKLKEEYITMDLAKSEIASSVNEKDDDDDDKSNKPKFGSAEYREKYLKKGNKKEAKAGANPKDEEKVDEQTKVKYSEKELMQLERDVKNGALLTGPSVNEQTPGTSKAAKSAISMNKTIAKKAKAKGLPTMPGQEVNESKTSESNLASKYLRV